MLKFCFALSLVGLVGGIAQLALTNDYVFGGIAALVGLVGCIAYSLSRKNSTMTSEEKQAPRSKKFWFEYDVVRLPLAVLLGYWIVQVIRYFVGS